MPAIADSDDLYAWLIRGFVESGLPDHTRGGQEWSTAGALNLENFIQEQGVGGVLLQFRGQAGPELVPEDDYLYQVCVVRTEGGVAVVVRSEDTLFHHSFPGENHVAGHIVVQLRAHNGQFTEWRANGGVTTIGQRRGIPDARGASADRALITALESLRRANRSVVEGPRNKWWVTATAPAGPARIEVGYGREPTYITRKAVVTLSEEDLAHGARLQTAGMVLMVAAASSMLVMVIAAGYSGYDLWKMRTISAHGGTSMYAVCASVFYPVLHGFAGYRLRSLRSRGLVRVLVILGMLPCVVPCCALGAPIGAWVVLLLQDERSTRVFND